MHVYVFIIYKRYQVYLVKILVYLVAYMFIICLN